jgi:hypothetical protein
MGHAARACRLEAAALEGQEAGQEAMSDVLRGCECAVDFSHNAGRALSCAVLPGMHHTLGREDDRLKRIAEEGFDRYAPPAEGGR